MLYIRTMRLTPHQANELVHKGFFVKLVKMLAGNFDFYDISVKA